MAKKGKKCYIINPKRRIIDSIEEVEKDMLKRVNRHVEDELFIKKIGRKLKYTILKDKKVGLYSLSLYSEDFPQTKNSYFGDSTLIFKAIPQEINDILFGILQTLQGLSFTII